MERRTPPNNSEAIGSLSSTTSCWRHIRAQVLSFLRALWPAAQPINAKEKWRACCGAVLGIVMAAVGSQWMMADAAIAHGHTMLALWLVAPMGASAVLVFAAPASPLAQPWSVLGGNTLSALIGIARARWVPDATLAAGLAVGLAIALMFALRCLHPPGGASALLAVLVGVTDFGYVLSPVLLNSTLLAIVGVVYNNITRRPWPHVHRPQSAGATGGRFSAADLDAALVRYNQVVDIDRDDLEDILRQAEAAAYQRLLGDLRCRDIMTPNPVTVHFESSLRHAWTLMRERRVKALPVVDVQHHLVGIVTVADFMKQVDLDVHEGWSWRLRKLVRASRNTAATTGIVGQIMTRRVSVVSDDRPIVDLVPVFSDDGHRHIPIVDAEHRLVGIVTQSDLIRSLYRATIGRA
ncbi:HPP family protein [Acidovorax sp. SDU_ACID1]|uniref:HPP family protein n=1 Tax=Acidovorax sp. SDU_ACID1 TaxID=3136632 RepID=UPI003873C397